MISSQVGKAGEYEQGETLPLYIPKDRRSEIRVKS